jgi:hypothetical protein
MGSVMGLNVAAWLLLQIGWAKVQELRRYIKLFRDSGKFTIAYMKTGGEKEYYLASAFQELVIAPTANIRLAGFSVAGGGLAGWVPLLQLLRRAGRCHPAVAELPCSVPHKLRVGDISAGKAVHHIQYQLCTVIACDVLSARRLSSAAN